MIACLNSRTAVYAIRTYGGKGGGLSDGAPYPDRLSWFVYGLSA